MSKPKILLYEPKVPEALDYDLSDVLEKYVDTSGDCWEWRLALAPDGYGRKSWRINGKKTFRMAHRWIYQLAGNAIPEGLELDHLCRNRGCVNPDHLEPVTRQENHLRGEGRFNRVGQTLCKRGHDLSDAYQYGSGPRNCRQCAALRYKERANAK